MRSVLKQSPELQLQPLLSQSAVAVVATGSPVSPHPAQRTLITHIKYWPLIGQYRITWPQYWPLIGSCDNHDILLHGPDLLHPCHHPRVFLCRSAHSIFFIRWVKCIASYSSKYSDNISASIVTFLYSLTQRFESSLSNVEQTWSSQETEQCILKLKGAVSAQC